ncbi:MAG: thiamine phosphate synthase [Lachnoclostridium sp.]|nr:thiamine phosphate synthase [Lachnoclostridium sp.]
MRDNPLKIAITAEHPVSDESHKITMLLGNGWDYVHLRHPSASRREMQSILEGVDLRLHDRIVLHGHFDLINDFNIGGVHLNNRCPEAPASFRGRVSCSCHSVEEVMVCDSLDYVTLSPIFPSISKPGYSGNFTDDSLRKISQARVPVVALGGITSENVSRLSAYPFAGYAVLGSLEWESDIRRFLNNIQQF